MDTQTLIAVVASAVVLLGLVLVLAFRRKPQLPDAPTEREELPSTGLPTATRAEPSREARKPEAAAPKTPAGAQPSAPREAEHEQEEAAAPVPTEHEKDVAAIRKGLANTRGGLIARLAKLFGGRSTIDQSLLDEI